MDDNSKRFMKIDSACITQPHLQRNGCFTPSEFIDDPVYSNSCNLVISGVFEDDLPFMLFVRYR
jgi:hypothetical protein